MEDYNRSREVYNILADTYDMRQTNPTTDAIRNLERKFFKIVGRGRVLDIGCGTGYHFQQFRNAIGIDVSEGMLLKAKDKDSKNMVILADAENIPFPDKSFENVFCLYSVINLCDYNAVIQEISRLLKPGGLVIISLASIFDTGISFREKLKERKAMKTKTKRLRIEKQRLNLHLFTPEDIISAFKKMGLHMERFDSLFIFQNPKWGNYNVMTCSENLKLALERLVPFKSIKEMGCFYMMAFRKPS